MKQTTMRKALPATALTVALATTAISTSAVAASDGSATLYGSFRPVLATGDLAGTVDNKATDIEDASSRIGLKGQSDLGNGITGFFKWEVDVNVENGRDSDPFQKHRFAIAGLKWGNSSIALGTQRTINYLLVNEYVDLFNHRNSPFGLNDGSVEGFFTSDAVTYTYSKNDFQFMAQTRTNGTSGDDDLDYAGAGASYKAGPVYFAVVYNEQHDGSGDDVEQVNYGVAADVGPVYVAVAFVDTDRDAGDDTETLDISAAMPLGNGYKVKVGYFDAEINGFDGDGFDGFNVTLEKQLKNVRLHAELLSADVDDGVTGISVADGEVLSVGVRYDFSIGL